MNDYYVDIGYKSIHHFGEELCGDHVDVVRNGADTTIVLADGLGSGVQASILSTLTARIISTMVASGLSLEDCVETIASTLPVSKEKGVAYSTFTIIHVLNNEVAELIQYDNPDIIFIRDGAVTDYRKTELNVGGKKIYKSTIYLMEDDVFVAMSDGCPYASDKPAYNYAWGPKQIAEFMEMLVIAGYTTRNLSTMLVDECYKLYGEHARDDVTACVVKVKKRVPVNLMFGPPSNRNDADKMVSLFLSKAGKHIVCGGTTASIVAKWLRKPVNAKNNVEKTDIPPMSEIEGLDLVTEGVVTMNRVVEYAKDYIGANDRYEEWSMKRDGASRIARMLFEEATDVNLFVGKAINPAHQDPNMPFHFIFKMKLVEELEDALKKLGKTVRVSYF